MNDGAHTLLCIPESGLFYGAGKFYSGRGLDVPWDGTIHVYPSFVAAVDARERIIAANPGIAGEIVVLPIHMEEHNANQT